MIRTRYIDLIRGMAFRHQKMAFVAGPRQVGKTTLAGQLCPDPEACTRFSWDDVEFRRAWIRDPKALIPMDAARRRTVIFDELHKAPRWKSLLKGAYDMRGEHADIVVTGSARLDVFRRGGDSLLGRYFLFRLHPLSAGEVSDIPPASPDTLAARLRDRIEADAGTLGMLDEFGGFPEPFLNADRVFRTVWSRMRTERLMREDLRDLSRVQEIALIEAAAALLPSRVGSPFSQKSLAEDLEVSQPTAKRWVTWFTHLYYAFRVQPYARRVARALRKQPKLYLWDWSEVADTAARFENLVASHLLKAVHFWTDSGLGTFDLCYLRDREKREVDFLVVRDRKPWLMVECKLNDARPSQHLRAFSDVLTPALVLQVVGATGLKEWFDLGAKERGMVVSADAFLRLLP